MADAPLEKVDGCDLCEAARITPWFHEDDVCWIAECEICYVPMVVWRSHGNDPPADQLAHMHAQLARIAAETLTVEHWLDDNMRNIPDHYHAHACPQAGSSGTAIAAPTESSVAVAPGARRAVGRGRRGRGRARAGLRVHPADHAPASWNCAVELEHRAVARHRNVNLADLPGSTCWSTASPSDVNVWGRLPFVLHLEGDLLARLGLDERGIEVLVVQLHFELGVDFELTSFVPLMVTFWPELHRSLGRRRRRCRRRTRTRARPPRPRAECVLVDLIESSFSPRSTDRTAVGIASTPRGIPWPRQSSDPPTP